MRKVVQSIALSGSKISTILHSFLATETIRPQTPASGPFMGIHSAAEKVKGTRRGCGSRRQQQLEEKQWID